MSTYDATLAGRQPGEGQDNGQASISTPSIITKRRRPTKNEMRAIREALRDVTAEHYPASVRQIYYQCTVLGLTPKTERGCRQVQRALAEMRLDGSLPFEWIRDRTRRQNRPATFDGIGEGVAALAEKYRRPLWKHADCTVQVWLEKHALEGVVETVTSELDVPLFVSRGYASLTQIKDAADEIAADGRPCFVFQFGDFEPSGVGIADSLESTLRQLAPEAEIYFERVAVTTEQITRYGLPDRPTRKTDSRSNGWTCGSVELDALRPNVLRDLVRNCILQHMDADVVAEIRDEEERDLRSLADWAARYERGAL